MHDYFGSVCKSNMEKNFDFPSRYRCNTTSSMCDISYSCSIDHTLKKRMNSAEVRRLLYILITAKHNTPRKCIHAASST